jgi:hypothetical protein
MIRLAFFGHDHIDTANFDHHLGFGVYISVLDGRDHSSQFNRWSESGHPQLLLPERLPVRQRQPQWPFVPAPVPGWRHRSEMVHRLF